MNLVGSELISRILESSIFGSIAIILVLAIAPWIRRWLGAQAAHALWLLVLARLLVPWSPEGIIPRTPIEAATSHMEGRLFTQTHISISVEDTSVPAPAPIVSGEPPPDLYHWLTMVWATSALALILLLIVRATRASLLVRRTPDITSTPRIQRVLSELGSIPRRLRICKTHELRSPALCGLWRPTILIPADWDLQMSSVELRHVVSHEIGHFRRGDLWWKWAFQIAIAVHWFNPLVWFAGRIARTDLEMACDEWVLSHQSNPDAMQYGETILATSSRLRRTSIASPVHAGMAETKSGLHRRIRQIARFQNHGLKALLTAIVLTCLLWLVVSPSHIQAEGPNQSSPPFQPAPETLLSSSPNESEVPANTKPQWVKIEAKFLSISPAQADQIFGTDPQSILSDKEFENILRRLNQIEGIDLVSTLSVTTKSNQRATIQIVREFPYPTEFITNSEGLKGQSTPTSFETVPLGLTLEVQPFVTSEKKITLIVMPSIVDFVGFVNYGSSYPARTSSSSDALSSVLDASGGSSNVINQPIFETRRVSASVVLESGKTVMLGDMGTSEGKVSQIMKPAIANLKSGKVVSKDKSDGGKNRPLSLYVFITARIVNAESRPTIVSVGPVYTTPLPELSDHSNMPGMEYGTAVPDKPGYVISPYAPKSGYVDLRGFPRGVEVKCPYTGRLFLAP